MIQGHYIYSALYFYWGFPGGSDACNVGDPGLIPGSGRSPGEENGNPPKYFCPDNSQGQRSLVGYGPWGHKESDTTEGLTLSLLTSIIISAPSQIIKH